jgi:hypothetical protein
MIPKQLTIKLPIPDFQFHILLLFILYQHIREDTKINKILMQVSHNDLNTQLC